MPCVLLEPENKVNRIAGAADIRGFPFIQSEPSHSA